MATQPQPVEVDIEEHEPVVEERRAKRLYFILGAVVLALVVIYGIYALVTSGKETTDDAQIAADVVPIAARVSGQVLSVNIIENQPVHKGDLLVTIDPQDAQVKLAQAQGDLQTALAQAAEADAKVTVAGANARGAFTAAQAAVQSSRETVDTSGAAIRDARAGVTRAEANAQKASLDYKRAQELGAKGDIAKAQVDAAKAAYETADADLVSARAKLSSAENARQAAQSNVTQAQGRLEQSSPVAAQVNAAQAEAQLAHAKVQSAQAALQAAQLNMSYTRITAPVDGIASRLAVHPGVLVATGMPVVQLVPRNTYVVANFKETQMRNMRAGQRVTVKVDVIHGKEFEGKVQSVSGGTGASFSLLPPDNASGNFVKVVQRVPVRVSWNGPDASQAPVGSSAEVTVYTK